MKKLFVLSVCCLVLAVLLLKSGSVDWKDYLKGALNRTIDTVEEAYLKLKVSDPVLYKNFKQQSDALQAQINTYLDEYDHQHDNELLQHAHELYEKLHKEQLLMRKKAKNKLSPEDFEHLDKELKRLDELFERFGSELKINDDKDEVAIQAVGLEPELFQEEEMSEDDDDNNHDDLFDDSDEPSLLFNDDAEW